MLNVRRIIADNVLTDTNKAISVYGVFGRALQPERNAARALVELLKDLPVRANSPYRPLIRQAIKNYESARKNK